MADSYIEHASVKLRGLEVTAATVEGERLIYVGYGIEGAWLKVDEAEQLAAVLEEVARGQREVA